jgi:hypothetical protein
LKPSLSFIPLVENPLHVFTVCTFNPTLTFFEMILDVPRRLPKYIFMFRDRDRDCEHPVHGLRLEVDQVCCMILSLMPSIPFFLRTRSR